MAGGRNQTLIMGCLLHFLNCNCGIWYLALALALAFGLALTLPLALAMAMAMTFSCDFACRYQSFAFICISHKKLRYHLAATVCRVGSSPVQPNPFFGIAVESRIGPKTKTILQLLAPSTCISEFLYLLKKKAK